MNGKEIVRAGYNRIASHYLSTRSADGDDVRLLDDLIGRLSVGARVLDAGCGGGVPVTRLLSQHFEVTGVDFAEEQIALARALVPGARFLCQDMTTLALADESLDAVCSYYAIIHIPREEHRPLLRNFQRMLKPGGLALLCLGQSAIDEDLDDFYGAPMYWSHFDAATNLHLMDECGFGLVWAKTVADASAEGAAHLFVLAQKR